ncbi:cytochrome P450 [Nonomuraea rubra]|uniref:Cytochrome P450 n=1 Tax=Nonomuraea rubra TaxID=46180 RepID=A0A7X0TZE9_9ACTN|nr:cytochrome P450 [Nonomuraea rubra]MBB6549511.1 cytochrome P450 [Nonomuraea rubra]
MAAGGFDAVADFAGRLPMDVVCELMGVPEADRDERVFPEPDCYDLDRDTSPLISFGGGRHFCLGAGLGRLEARPAPTEFVRLVRAYDVHEDHAVRVHPVNVRGFAALPVTVTPR